jgi:4-amino-4-deoxy-L-arabinose transferase-like glycosyltransferase
MNQGLDAMTSRRPTPRWIWLAASGGLLLLGAVGNLAYLLNDCPLDLAGDEAHYWEWSRRLDLSYYSKGPLVAYVIAGGRALLAEWSEQQVGSEMLAVRIPAIVLSTLTGLGVLVLALRTTRSAALAFAALLIAATIPMAAVGAKLMTIDAPLATCWVWTLVCLHAALRHDRRRAWLGVGILTAAGLLAKYNMLFIYPVIAALLLLEPTLRPWLRRPAPYVAAIVGLAGLVPILIWNARNGWVSFRHVAGQAGVAEATQLYPIGPLEYLAGQLAVGNALWVLGMWIAGVLLWRRSRQAAAPPAGKTEPWELRLLIISMFVPWLVFLLFSPITKIQPNWPALAYVTGPIVLAIGLHALWDAQPHRRPRLAAYGAGGGVIGLLAIVLIHNTAWLMPVFKWLSRDAAPWELTPIARYDPTARLRGWAELGHAVGQLVAAERAAGRDPFILTDHYMTASEIAFYAPGEPTVYCAQSVLGHRMSQYDLWLNPIDHPERFTGNRPVIYVGRAQDVLTGTDIAPGALVNPQRVAVVRETVAGADLQVWPLWKADAFRGFPRGRGPRRF